MNIGSADPVAVNANSFQSILWPFGWLSGNREARFVPGNYNTLINFHFISEMVGHSILLGFGVSNLMFGKIMRFSNSTMAFTTLVIAEAPSECPRFGLTWEVSQENRRKD
jgi:hypothetical protein